MDDCAWQVRVALISIQRARKLLEAWGAKQQAEALLRPLGQLEHVLGEILDGNPPQG